MHKEFFRKPFWFLIPICLALFLFSLAAQAQGILPSGPTVSTPGVCELYVSGSGGVYTSEKAFKDAFARAPDERSTVLGCAIKTGRVRLYMMPFFITYLIQFLLGIAGIIAVLFVVLGGYKYTVGGLIEEKEEGKKYIINALLGLVVALSAWLIVNLVQIALTK